MPEQDEEIINQQIQELLKKQEDLNFKEDYVDQRERDLEKEMGVLRVFWSGDEVFPPEKLQELHI